MTAAVGRQNACPSGAVLHPPHFPGKIAAVGSHFICPPAALTNCLASGTALPPLHEIPRLRKYPVFVSRNVSPSLYEISSQQRQISCVSVAGAFFHLRREHLLSRHLRPLEGKTHVHRARYCSHFAAVGSLSMPSATLSRQNRGRWKPFYMSTGRAHKLPRLRKYFASRTVPPPELSRFRNCPASGTALPPLPELSRFRNCLRLRNCPASAKAIIRSAP